MNRVLMSLLSFVILSGCVGTSVRYEDGMRIRTAGETNLFRPSLSVLDVAICVEAPGTVETNAVDGETEICQGTYQPLATVQGTQAGALTGLGGAMVQGGAIAAGAYLLGDGIRDSASRVTQTGGGANSEASAQGGQARSSSKASAYSKSQQSQHQRQSQMPMMPGRD